MNKISTEITNSITKIVIIKTTEKLWPDKTLIKYYTTYVSSAPNPPKV